MSNAQTPSAAEDRFSPVLGREAFETESPAATSSRAGQLLAMGTYAFGDAQQVLDVRDDAESLGAPFVAPTSDEHSLWRQQQNLDELTRLALQDHGASDPRDWTPGAPTRRDDELALWNEIALTHAATALLALLNYSLGSVHELQRVAAASALTGHSGGELGRANAILIDALQSTDDHVAQVAAACLGVDREQMALGDTGYDAPPVDRMAEDEARGEVSTALNGTWAQVSADPWYAPGQPLHSHIQSTSTNNLFGGDTYFTWSGEYSQEARDLGALKLTTWRSIHSFTLFDTVFAHSHGGNVALTAAANGELIRLLVLMHTPALPRLDDQWAAIRSRVARVMVLRTRLDHVVLADGFRNGSKQRFDQSKLPHEPFVLHWAKKDAWFSHSFFTELDTWKKYKIASAVIREHAYVGDLAVPTHT